MAKHDYCFDYVITLLKNFIISYHKWLGGPWNTLLSRPWLDDPKYVGHLGHFFGGSTGEVGLIHKLNYLDVTRIINRSHVL